MNQPDVTGYFDSATNTISYVVVDPATNNCAIIDSLLDYDAPSGQTSTVSADKLIKHVQNKNLTVEWIIDTHVHADHLTAAPYIQSSLGGKTGIGNPIAQVQKEFGDFFNTEPDFPTDGSQFDHLFTDGEQYSIGSLKAQVLHTPGHTPACMSHLVEDALFVGDTLFMPDYGSARCDFPGGDAGELFDSVQKLYALPDETRMFLCHDYKSKDRDEYQWETTVGKQKQTNIHITSDTSREDFVNLRESRDATLGMPKLILPSVQVNIRAGELPPPESNGQRYIKIPINRL